MICPFCDGALSKVYPHGGTITAMYCPPYYDEEGRFHHHDVNWRNEEYSCSNGHQWVVGSQGQCPSCSWPDAEPEIRRLDKPEEVER
jgi:hypothetical protein